MNREARQSINISARISYQMNGGGGALLRNRSLNELVDCLSSGGNCFSLLHD